MMWLSRMEPLTDRASGHRLEAAKIARAGTVGIGAMLIVSVALEFSVPATDARVSQSSGPSSLRSGSVVIEGNTLGTIPVVPGTLPCNSNSALSANSKGARSRAATAVRTNGAINTQCDALPLNSFSFFAAQRYQGGLMLAQNIIPPHPDSVGGGNPLQGLGRPDESLPARNLDGSLPSPSSSQFNSGLGSGTNGSGGGGTSFGSGFSSSSTAQTGSLSSPDAQATANPRGSDAEARSLMYPSILTTPDARNSQSGASSGSRLTQAFGDSASGGSLGDSGGLGAGLGGAGLGTGGGLGAGGGLGTTDGGFGNGGSPGAAGGLGGTGITGDTAGLAYPGAGSTGLPTTGGLGDGTGLPSGLGIPGGLPAGSTDGSALPPGLGGSPLPPVEGLGSGGLGGGGLGSSTPSSLPQTGASQNNEDLAKALQSISADPDKSKSLLQMLQAQQGNLPPAPGDESSGLVPPPPPLARSSTPAGGKEQGESPLKKVLLLINTKKYSVAETQLKNHITQYPNDMQAHYLLAITLVLSKQYGEAEQQYRYVVDNCTDQSLLERARTGLRKLSR